MIGSAARAEKYAFLRKIGVDQVIDRKPVYHRANSIPARVPLQYAVESTRAATAVPLSHGIAMTQDAPEPPGGSRHRIGGGRRQVTSGASSRDGLGRKPSLVIASARTSVRRN